MEAIQPKTLKTINRITFQQSKRRDMLAAPEQKEFKEWKDEYEGTLGKYIETVEVALDTAVNGCVKHIECKFSQITTGSFKIEASGDAIPKAATIAQNAQKESKEKWESRDFLEVEDIHTSTEKG